MARREDEIGPINDPPEPEPTPSPSPTVDAIIDPNQDTTSGGDVGDIPPPPVPPPPPVVQGPGVAGVAGTEGGTFARPGGAGIAPFRTPNFFQNRAQPRFGPGVPTLGGGSTDVAGLGGQPQFTDDDLAQILATVAGRYRG